MAEASALETAQILVVGLLLGCALGGLVAAALECRDTWTRAPRTTLGLLGAAVVLGAIARLAVPHELATIFIGYRWTWQCIELLPISHYGAGSQMLYHLVFQVLPADHETLMGVNAVLGTLAIPLLGTLGARIFRSPRAGAIAALLVAVVPIFVRNDTSDANNVPVILWLSAGLLLVHAWARDGGRGRLAPAAGLLVLAAVSRPEMMGLAPVLAALVAWAAPPKVGLFRDRRLWIALAAAGLLLVPHLLHILASIEELRSRSSLPGLDLSRLFGLVWLWDTNAVVAPDLFPAAITILAAVALLFARGSDHRGHGALLAAFLLCSAAYFSDLDHANVARVHVPAALMAVLLAAAGIDSLWSRFGIAAAFVAALAVGASAVPSAQTLFAPTNEAQEDDFLSDALAKLPAADPITIVHIGPRDRRRFGGDEVHTHDHLPRYRVELPPRGGRILDIGTAIDSDSLGAGAWYVEGMRCFARFRIPVEPVPAGENLQSACRAMREAFELEPVFERVVPNHGDRWISYFGDADELTLRLYRIGRRR